MENSNLRESVDKDVVMEMSKTAGIGLAGGSAWGALNFMLNDGPQVGSNVKYPQLTSAAKVCGNYAATGAVLGATYVGIEQVLENNRMMDFVNGAVAGFAAGATVFSFKGNTVMASLKVLAAVNSSNSVSTNLWSVMFKSSVILVALESFSYYFN
jgi:mitochondrial import inner membrane translocase subunit TIM22